MGSTILSLLSGAVGAAIVGGVFSLITHRLNRKDKLADQATEKKENEQEKAEVEHKALRYIMLYIIQERAKSHIKDGKITLEERRSLHHWHALYHDKEPNGLGGNGDADDLMARVDELPLDFEE